MAILTKGLIAILLALAACSGAEQAEEEKIRRQNAKGEYIYRRHGECLYPLRPPQYRPREKYPWEQHQTGRHARITKEYFRCRGSAHSPPHSRSEKETVYDCGGKQKHSLPLRDNKEFIYPILIDLLNYIQNTTGKKVIVTCGHRCPAHNTYADDSPLNQTSKHMIGAEVDFYVQGMENAPETIVSLLMQYFWETPPYKGKKEYIEFLRYEKSDTNVSTEPWYNKEVLIKLFKKTEGRDFDNRHPYPYLSIQVRFDRDKNERAVYSWQKAFNGYLRY